ncbi:hypothetical protein AMEJIAPC_01918 [Caulobacter sp. NIBR1757]|nr:hypothetical protein AMEJIAPC_01918 [Caulobacter sp. NIBR1757]
MWLAATLVALAPVFAIILEAFGIKVPFVKELRGRTKLVVASMFLVGFIGLLYFQAQTGKTLDEIAACTLFSNGAACKSDAEKAVNDAADAVALTAVDPTVLPPAVNARAEQSAPVSRDLCDASARSNGNWEANQMYEEARVLSLGINGRRDEGAARLLYKSAADLGHPSAQFNLGNMFHEGRGGPVDADQAIYWWSRAASQGFGPPMENLMGAYSGTWKGFPPRDFAQMVRWGRELDRCNQPRVLNNLGIIYASGGYGVEPDNALGRQYFNRAIAAQSPRAEGNLRLLESRAAATADDYRWE